MFSEILIIAACALGALAKTTTSMASVTSAPNTATASLLFSATTGVAASVVAADSCDTTYQIICTDTDACSGYALTFTVTEGPTDYRFTYATTTLGATGTAEESCSLSGSTYAVCSAGIYLTADGSHTSTHTKTTVSGTAFSYAQVPITAGGDRIASATGSCTKSGNAAAATGVSEIYRVLVVPAAAAALAGVLL